MEEFKVNIDNNNIKNFKVDYFSKYYFYDKEDFKNEEDGEFILEKINQCNRFDYKGYTYKYSKFNNVVKGETKKDVDIQIDESLDTVVIDSNIKRLDLNYKFQTKELEDHIRIATKITDEHNENSCLLYINNSYAKEFLKSLNKVKQNQENIMKN